MNMIIIEYHGLCQTFMCFFAKDSSKINSCSLVSWESLHLNTSAHKHGFMWGLGFRIMTLHSHLQSCQTSCHPRRHYTTNNKTNESEAEKDPGSSDFSAAFSPGDPNTRPFISQPEQTTELLGLHEWVNVPNIMRKHQTGRTGRGVCEGLWGSGI